VDHTRRVRGVFARLLQLTLLSALLVACGGAAPTTAPAVATEAPAAAPEIGGKLVVWYSNGGSNYDAAAIEGFKAKYPDVELEVSDMPFEDLNNKVSAALTSGEGAPDIAMMERSFLPVFIATGALEDLTDRVQPYINEYPASTLAASSDANGRIYGVTMDAAPPGVMFYRPDIFEKYGVEVPTTWEEWVAAGHKLTMDTDGDGEIDQYMGSFANASGGYFMMFVQCKGGQIFDKDGNVTTDDPILVDTFKWYVDMIKEEKIVEASSFFSPGWYAQIGAGRYATMPNAFWMGQLFKASIPETEGKWKIAPWPDGEGCGWGGSSMVVFKQSQNKDAAWAFLEYVDFDVENVLQRFQEKGTFPGIASAFSDPRFNEPDPWWMNEAPGPILLDSVMNANTLNFGPNYQLALNALTTAMVDVLDQGVDPDVALQTAGETIRRGLEQ